METGELIKRTEDRFIYETEDFTIKVNGYLPSDTGSMKVNLLIIGKVLSLKWRGSIDLFEYGQIMRAVGRMFERVDTEQAFLSESLDHALIDLGEQLDEQRLEEIQQNNSNGIMEDGSAELTNEAERDAVAFLSQDDLMDNLGNAIEKSGIVGNRNTVFTAFIIAISHLLPKPLHAIISGSSGMGKSHTLHSVFNLIPQEMLVRVTRITNKSLYNYKDGDLTNKLFAIEDYDGLEEDAELALRELQSSGYLGSSTVEKVRYGNELRAKLKRLKTHMSTLTTTTRTELRDDNESRSIVLGIDESEEQTRRIIDYQNSKFTGKVDKEVERAIQKDIRNVVRKLKQVPVVNPYADKLRLPFGGSLLRRLNEHLNIFITVVTLLHQYQRPLNAEGKLESTIKDIEIAVELLLDAIILKRDYLDSSTRQFFEELKDYVEEHKQGTESFTFKQRDIREYTGKSAANVKKHLRLLHELEYVRASGNANKGFDYEVVYNAGLETIRTEVKETLYEQIQEL